LNELLEQSNAHIDRQISEQNRKKNVERNVQESKYQHALNEYNARSQKYINAEKLLSTIIMEQSNYMSQLETKVNLLTNKQ